MSLFLTYLLVFQFLTSAAVEKRKKKEKKNLTTSQSLKLINTNEFHTWYFFLT